MGLLDVKEVIDRVQTLQNDYSIMREESRDGLDLYAGRLIPKLPEDLARSEQISILSPAVRHAAHTIRSQELTFPTEFTCTPTEREPGGGVLEKHKRMADNIEKADAIWWSQMNLGRRLDRAVYWRMLVQPLAILVLEMGAINKADPAQRMPWKIVDVDFRQCAWVGEDNIPSHFGRHYRQLFAEAAAKYSRRRNTEHAQHDLTFKDGKVAWVPVGETTNYQDGRPVMLGAGSSSSGLQQMEMFFYDDGENCYTVGLDAASSRVNIGPFHFGGTKGREGQMLDVSPNYFGRCSAVLIPSNDTPLENPEDAYEEYLRPLMTLTAQLNVVQTIRATRSRNRAAPRDYVHVEPDVVQQLLARNLWPPQPVEWADGKTPHIPGELKQRPMDVDEDLDKLQQALQKESDAYKPSGNAGLTDPEVLKATTAAAWLGAIDANVLLLAPMLGSYDAGRKQLIEMMHESVEQLGKAGTAYADFILTATEEVSLSNNRSAPVGTQVQLTPDALNFGHMLAVSTKSMTTAQRQALHELAVQRMQPLPDGSPGTGTREDVYQADGYTDIEAQEIQQVVEMAGRDVKAVLTLQARLAMQRRIFLTTGMMLPLVDEQGAAIGAATGGGVAAGGQDQGMGGNQTHSPATEQATGGSAAPQGAP